MALSLGLEPITYSLTGSCSTIELQEYLVAEPQSRTEYLGLWDPRDNRFTSLLLRQYMISISVVNKKCLTLCIIQHSYSSKDWSVWFAGRTCQLTLCLPMAQGYGVLLLVIVIEHVYDILFLSSWDICTCLSLLGQFLRGDRLLVIMDCISQTICVHIRPWVVGGNRNILYTAGGWISHSYLERI